MSASGVQITNICAKFNIGCNLNLDEILTNDYYLCLTKKKFNRIKYSGLTAKYFDTKITFMLFSTGNVIITGAKTCESIENAAYELAFTLHYIGPYEAKVVNLKITNYCGSYRFGSNIDINRICIERSTQCDYNPELFTSMKYIIDNKKLTLTHKGVLFGTGFKTKEDMTDIFNKAIKEVEPYMRKSDEIAIENRN
jgi:TATA-box binding protein (TBP) (component of TFIID and TFIIIB)